MEAAGGGDYADVAGSTFAYWLYVDSSGAEYRLDQNNSGVWTSLEGVYVAYDSNTNRLQFPDGSWWFLGCQSQDAADSGTLYPTTLEDTNGNSMTVQYLNGASARITSITDPRTPYSTAHCYSFTYNSDPLPHLISVTNGLGTGESYTFTYAT